MALPAAVIGNLLLNNIDKIELLYSKLAPVLSKGESNDLRQQFDEMVAQLEQAKRDTRMLVESNEAAKNALRVQHRITLAALVVAALSLVVAGGALFIRL